MWQKLQGMPDLPMKLGLLALYVIGAVYVGTQQEVWHTMAESVAMPLLDTRQGKDLMGTFIADVLILSVLMVLIIWVYMANEMYFVNPVLNIVGYKAFSIVYHKSTSAKRLDDDKSLQSFEIKVFSREPLNRMTREKLFVTFSPHDFSICYSIPREKSDL